jgi:hypothetical protein
MGCPVHKEKHARISSWYDILLSSQGGDRESTCVLYKWEVLPLVAPSGAIALTSKRGCVIVKKHKPVGLRASCTISVDQARDGLMKQI